MRESECESGWWQGLAGWRRAAHRSNGKQCPLGALLPVLILTCVQGHLAMSPPPPFPFAKFLDISEQQDSQNNANHVVAAGTYRICQSHFSQIDWADSRPHEYIKLTGT